MQQYSCHIKNGGIYRIDCSTTEGSIERTFVNRLSSIVKNILLAQGPDHPDSFRCRYLLEQVSTKSPFSSVSNNSQDRRSMAINKTLAANEHCRVINSDDARWNDPAFRSYLERARVIVHKVLGDFTFDVYKYASFSNGASTSNPYGLCGSFYKYASLQYGGIEVTPSAYTRLLALIDNTPTMNRCLLRAAFNGIDPIKIVDSDKLTTVPKNSKTDRSILIQPNGLNILQKAVGTYIRSRLKLFGVDLTDQTVNQELARVGSLRGSHSTIDLSSASDTLNARIVWELTPTRWFEELERLRTSQGRLPDGQMVTWHMFSAMGNAITFELESLIFYALARAACDELGSSVGRVNVFGDDIIVPNSCGTNVCERLTQCGFIVNNDKTFTSGKFRESCGAHYYDGYDVKPFYIRTNLTKIESIIRLANQLRKWSSCNGACDPRFLRLWEYLASFVPPFLHNGTDMDSSLSLVTSQRKDIKCFKLIALKYDIPIEGDAALAASMQSWVCGEFHGIRGYTRDISNEMNGNVLQRVSEDVYLLGTHSYSDTLASPPLWYILKPNGWTSI